MLIERRALQQELPALNVQGTKDLCELLAYLGFPVDGVEEKDGQTVLEVDVTANRGDALSHRGLARDLAAKLEAHLTPLPYVALTEGAALFPIRLEAEACPLYATAILELGTPSGTPDDVASFLASMGSNTKQLAAVDASNELLHRYGHPTHAFDADTLKGGIIVRWAKPGETLTTLDGVERKLTSQDLLIADEAGPIALAGLMGGDSTKVNDQTKRVLLESAYFDPRVVRRMAHRHGLHTDASHRFGRGADPAMARIARDLLASRLQAWAGATLKGAWTEGNAPSAAKPVPLTPSTLHRIAGEVVPMDEAAGCLRRLGCKVESCGEALSVVTPTWRHDMVIEEDLAEEVLRMRGYDRIGSALPPLEGAPEPLSLEYLQRRKVAHRLAQLGFHQTVTLGFVSPGMDASCPRVGDQDEDAAEFRTLSNPLGLEYSVMRASLLPSLKVVAEHNLRQGAKEMRLFEVAPVHRGRKDGTSEHMHLGLVWSGEVCADGLLTQRKLRPVHEADLIGLARDLGCAEPLDVIDLGEGILGLELPLELLEGAFDRVIPTFRPFSRTMRVERDLSLLVDLRQAYKPLMDIIKAVLPAQCLVEGPKLVDIFRHKSLPAEKQAWLVRMAFQAPDRTLTSEEVDAWMASALKAAQEQGATLRS